MPTGQGFMLTWEVRVTVAPAVLGLVGLARVAKARVASVMAALAELANGLWPQRWTGEASDEANSYIPHKTKTSTCSSMHALPVTGI